MPRTFSHKFFTSFSVKVPPFFSLSMCSSISPCCELMIYVQRLVFYSWVWQEDRWYFLGWNSCGRAEHTEIQLALVTTLRYIQHSQYIFPESRLAGKQSSFVQHEAGRVCLSTWHTHSTVLALVIIVCEWMVDKMAFLLGYLSTPYEMGPEVVHDCTITIIKQDNRRWLKMKLKDDDDTEW